MMDLNEVRKRILDVTPVLGRESVHVLDALGRALAQDIVVTEDFPASDISSLDGYAVARDSLRGVSPNVPARLLIIGESPAGKPFEGKVKAAEAVRIMTGGMIPEGADTVVRMEDAEEDGAYLICTHDPGPGDGIRPRGEYLKKGDVVLRAGDIVSPVEVGVLATLRRAYVYVHQKPRVAIVSTGDELTDFHEPSSPWKIMSSNLYTLTAQVLESGATPLCLGIVQDDPEAQRSLLTEALRADVVITSGGLSMGKYDLVKASFASLGMDDRFSTVFIKPGKPSIFGTIGKTLIFGLPGNPSAVMLSFDQFIKPALLKMMGHANVSETAVCLEESHYRQLSGPISAIDSFAHGHSGHSGEYKASLVPLGRPSPINGRCRPKAAAGCGSQSTTIVTRDMDP